MKKLCSFFFLAIFAVFTTSFAQDADTRVHTFAEYAANDPSVYGDSYTDKDVDIDLSDVVRDNAPAIMIHVDDGTIDKDLCYLKTSLITYQPKKLSGCSDAYDIYVKKYDGSFKIWAYFTIFEKGSTQELDNDEISIGFVPQEPPALSKPMRHKD